MNQKPRIGIVGCGNISKSYLTNIRRHGLLDVVAVADLDMDRARQRASEFGVSRVLAPDVLLADPEVEYVLNLTVPQAHLPVAMAALDSGKHVYNEKPLAATRDDARLICDKARSKGLRLGAAPDTFLGAGLQICRNWLDAGKIGQPVALEVVFNLRAYKDLNHFHWKKGGGVLMDIGPYYYAAMVSLLGAIKRISAFARFMPIPEVREKFPNWRSLIEVPSHISSSMEFASGVVGNVTITTEYCGYYDVLLKIYGTEATLICPDPNSFGGEAIISCFGEEKLREKAAGPLCGDSRGIGLADMTYAQRTGRPHRCNDQFAFHVLDAMSAVLDSAEQGTVVSLASTTDRPEPLNGDIAEALGAVPGRPPVTAESA